MAIDLGSTTISGPTEERTWNVSIATPADTSDPNDYEITVQREIVVRDLLSGKVVRRIRTKAEAGDEFPSFVPSFKFLAGQAMAIKKAVLLDIRYCVEEIRKGV